MSDIENKTDESDSIKQLQRALFYESQFRNAIVSDAVSFYDANISKDLIESDFFFRDEDNDFVSVPDFLGISTPCKFSEFVCRWVEMMVPNVNQRALDNISVLRETLLEVFEQGRREHVINYWAENIRGKKIFYNQRFLLTANEFGDVCALSITKDLTKVRELDDQHLHEELEQYAYFDPITNGYNYIKFKEKVREQAVVGSIISLDIHSFKTINSICGVSKGDDVIKYIWNCILTAISVEEKDVAAHINADHYIIFVPSVDESVIVKKIKDITLALLVISVEADVPQIQPYFGISKWYPGQKIEMSYSEAITAKHNAKYQQEINYAFFNEEDTLRLIKEKNMVDSFQEAIARKEFKIWFQPKYTPKNKVLVGAEALVRWIKEDGTIIKPDDFIPLFERNNMIRILDEYVFRNVCIMQKRWRDQNKINVPVSVNLSRASLYYKGVAEQYQRITEIVQIDPDMVPIEITESAAIANNDVKNVIDKFHECGFSMQMDDFGSGYSSLASLNLMHFDTIKLDKSLIDFIGNFGGNRLIEHTIALAKEMGIQITAEGVENEAQVKFLKNIGCDSIQGFYYSKPIPVEEFEKILDGMAIEYEETNIDKIEEHIYLFNQNYYKPAFYTFVINVTQDKITEYTEYSDWELETGKKVTDCIYSDAVEFLLENKILPESKEIFGNLLKRENILKRFTGNGITEIAEYKRHVNGVVKNMRVILNTFKLEESGDVFAYMKIYNLTEK